MSERSLNESVHDEVGRAVATSPTADEPNRTPISLLKCKGPSCKGAEAEVVEAILIDGVSDEEAKAADLTWTSFMQAVLESKSGLLRANYSSWEEFLRSAFYAAQLRGVPRDQLPENPHWEWVSKHNAAGAESHFFGVECEGQMQGLALLRTDKMCRLLDRAGRPMVYVDYLGSAPWNLPKLTDTPRFRGNGNILMAVAIQLSVDNEWEGRVGLHSLSGAEDFYRNPRKCGMADLGIDHMYGGLRYFEFDASGARAFLERINKR